MFKRTKISTGVLLALGGVVLAPMAAQAQDSQRIEVTGSRIKRVDAETAAPVQIITSEDIARTGKATVAEYLQTLTADGQGSIPKSFGNGFAAGGAGVSLRGLGAGSTLVLLNGRRIAPFGLADDGQKVFTDLSVVPLEAVDRVEVLKDGASAIYGSDAIAGVVNIILKREFKGITAKATYGISGDSDGRATKASVTGGFGSLASDRFNVFFNVEASDTKAIKVSDRKNRKWIGSGDLRPYGYSITGSQFLAGAITGNVTLPDGSTVTGTAAGGSPIGAVRNPTPVVDEDGNDRFLFQSLPGTCSQFSNVTPQDPNGGCLWQAGQFRDLTPSEKYVNLFGRGTFALSNATELYAEVGYSKKKTSFTNTPSGVSGAWGFPGGPVNASAGAGATVLGASHPDNPFPGTAVRLRYAAFDVGPRVGESDNEFTRFIAGAKTNFGSWDIDASVMHSETTLVNERRGFLRYSAVRAALSDPANPAGVWRIGQNANLNSAALYASISPTIKADAKSSLDQIDLRASTELGQMAGGTAGLAVGAEYRQLKTSLTPVTYTDQGDIIGLGYSAYDGKETVGSLYMEVFAPVAKGLEFTGALRADKYKDATDSFTPKFGVKITPLQSLAFRATYGEGFRQPNPAEAGKGGLAAFTTTRDPVRCPGGTPAAGATQADCAAPVAIITTPNPAVKPERSSSYTLGLVFEPTQSTTLTLDFWSITRTNEINQETISQAIAKGQVVRSDNDLSGIPNSGTLLAASASYKNSNSTKVRGWDMDIRQRFSLGELGKLSLDAQWTRLNLNLRTEEDGTKLQFAGTHGNCDVTNCIGSPKNRFNVGATLDANIWSISAVVNYVGGFKNIAFEGDGCANSFADGSDAPSGCKIPAFYTVDLSAKWKPIKSLELFGSVQNLLDKVAPLDPQTYGAINYNPLHSSGAVGRYFTVGAKYSF